MDDTHQTERESLAVRHASNPDTPTPVRYRTVSEGNAVSSSSDSCSLTAARHRSGQSLTTEPIGLALSTPQTQGETSAPEDTAAEASQPIQSVPVQEAEPAPQELHPQPHRRQYFHSRHLSSKESIDKPWLRDKDPRQKFGWILPVIGLLIGLGVAGFLIYDGLTRVENHEYCSILDENWSSGNVDDNVWLKEREVGGFGNGQFEETTTSTENAFVRDSSLIIAPTLQEPLFMNTNHTLNLTHDHTCTSPSLSWTACVASTNTTNGTVIPPVKSARLSTKLSIKYGRVEVVAKFPAGDWLWPAIWMLPRNSTYGAWPASGEIDIAESRGNDYSYPQGGNNIVSSAMHWGPSPSTDAWWRTNNKRKALRSTYHDKFHTFGLEWSEKYLFTYVDGRLAQTLYTRFDGGKSMWRKGKFPPAEGNGTALVDVWSHTGRGSTPFDEEFYLLINLAVGGTNGWFEDGVGGKMWVDGQKVGKARKSFWEGKDDWWPMWQKDRQGEFAIKSVRMWQQKGHNGC